MISDELGQALHDRATRGEELSPEEEAALATWYAGQDEQEEKMLGLRAGTEQLDLNNLRSGIEKGLSQLVIVSTRIQEMAMENETLRKENEGLKIQLAKLFGTEPA